MLRKLALAIATALALGACSNPTGVGQWVPDNSPTRGDDDHWTYHQLPDSLGN